MTFKCVNSAVYVMGIQEIEFNLLIVQLIKAVCDKHSHCGKQDYGFDETLVYSCKVALTFC